MKGCIYTSPLEGGEGRWEWGFCIGGFLYGCEDRSYCISVSVRLRMQLSMLSFRDRSLMANYERPMLSVPGGGGWEERTSPDFVASWTCMPGVWGGNWQRRCRWRAEVGTYSQLLGQTFRTFFSKTPWSIASIKGVDLYLKRKPKRERTVRSDRIGIQWDTPTYFPFFLDLETFASVRISNGK